MSTAVLLIPQRPQQPGWFSGWFSRGSSASGPTNCSFELFSQRIDTASQTTRDASLNQQLADISTQQNQNAVKTLALGSLAVISSTLAAPFTGGVSLVGIPATFGGMLYGFSDRAYVENWQTPRDAEVDAYMREYPQHSRSEAFDQVKGFKVVVIDLYNGASLGTLEQSHVGYYVSQMQHYYPGKFETEFNSFVQSQVSRSIIEHEAKNNVSEGTDLS